jgi:hypothetical protein
VRSVRGATQNCAEAYEPDKDVAREEEAVERLVRDTASAASSLASASGSTALPLIVAHNLRKRYAGARTSAVQVRPCVPSER